MKDYILALDQGTTSSRAILFDRAGVIEGKAQQELTQHYPQPAWVEHAPEDIWNSQIGVASRLLRANGLTHEDIAAIGICNQRETTILWDRHSGLPVANAIVWQDRRTAPLCEELRKQGLEPLFREKTGLPLDPYFSGTKILWLLDNVSGLRKRAERGEIAFGTVDSYLLWKLTGGRVHAADISNASRTLLCSLETCDWDDELLSLLKIPHALLPEIKASSQYYGETESELFGGPLPIGGMAGDQQAATFGQACLQSGLVKNTYGTGCFMLMNTGSDIIRSQHGLISTVSWKLEKEEPQISNPKCATYALEGSVFTAGAAVQWLRDELQILHSAAEIEALAASVPGTDGVYFVPAFVGLGAPYWDPHARGAILGLTRGASRAHLARAALEAVCFQTCAVLEAMRADSGLPIEELRVDGGMTCNNLLLQIQADLLGARVIRPVITETSAWGAACLAGLAVGFWNRTEDVAACWKIDSVFEPRISADQRAEMIAGWEQAVERVRC